MRKVLLAATALPAVADARMSVVHDTAYDTGLLAWSRPAGVRPASQRTTRNVRTTAAPTAPLRMGTICTVHLPGRTRTVQVATRDTTRHVPRRTVRPDLAVIA